LDDNNKLDFTEALTFFDDLETGLAHLCTAKYGGSGAGKIFYVNPENTPGPVSLEHGIPDGVKLTGHNHPFSKGEEGHKCKGDCGKPATYHSTSDHYCEECLTNAIETDNNTPRRRLLWPVFQEIDTDHNGTIEFSEFTEYVKKALSPFANESIISSRIEELKQVLASKPKIILDVRHHHLLNLMEGKDLPEVYTGGQFYCNGCSEIGCAWVYHCDLCNYDLHLNCAGNPEQEAAYEQEKLEKNKELVRAAYKSAHDLAVRLGLNETDIAECSGVNLGDLNNLISSAEAQELGNALGQAAEVMVGALEQSTGQCTQQ